MTYLGNPPISIKSCGNAAQEKELLLEYDRLNDYKNLVYVITGAWLMHKVKPNELQSEKVGPFIEKLITNTFDFRGLLDLYAMPGMADMFTHRDNSLGFDGWDWYHSDYPRSRCGTDYQRWIKPFYQFLLLKKAAQRDVYMTNLQNIRQTENASHESLKEFLGEIAGASFSIPPEYQSFTWTLNAAQLQEAKERINKLLNSLPSQSDTKSSDE